MFNSGKYQMICKNGNRNVEHDHFNSSNYLAQSTFKKLNLSKTTTTKGFITGNNGNETGKILKKNKKDFKRYKG